MAEKKEALIARPDIDIEEDVIRVFNVYPPLRHDRSRMEVTVKNGVVTAKGNVRTAQTRQIFEREVRKVSGVKDVKVDKLFDDGSLWLETGQITPDGVYTSVSYGAVVITGTLPENVTEKEIVKKIEKVPGVRKAIPNF